MRYSNSAMDRPSWQRDEDEEQMEYERVLHEQGEREAQELHHFRHWDEGDPLGLEDGRPGCAWTVNPFSGPQLFIPRAWQTIMAGLFLALIAAMLLLRFCVLH